jgi:xanthosine utilization system XapX-like protein
MDDHFWPAMYPGLIVGILYGLSLRGVFNTVVATIGGLIGAAIAYAIPQHERRLAVGHRPDRSFVSRCLPADEHRAEAFCSACEITASLETQSDAAAANSHVYLGFEPQLGTIAVVCH